MEFSPAKQIVANCCHEKPPPGKAWQNMIKITGLEIFTFKVKGIEIEGSDDIGVEMCNIRGRILHADFHAHVMHIGPF